VHEVARARQLLGGDACQVGGRAGFKILQRLDERADLGRELAQLADERIGSGRHEHQGSKSGSNRG
jgi:hypothetical protein